MICYWRSFLLLGATAFSCRALDIQFDYSYDSEGFFAGGNEYRRAVLEAAADRLEERISSELPPLVPSGNNTWTLGFPHPGDGTSVTLDNPVLAADTVVIYVGGRPREDGFLAFAEYFYSWNGNASWVTLWQQRDGENGFQSIGGSISFDANAAWYFDSEPRTLEGFSGYDFFSLAQHEIAHLLGFTDGAAAFRARVAANSFVGANTVALNGGGVPLAAGLDHFEAGTQYRDSQVNMTPFFIAGQRTPFTELDFAVLQDIGYSIRLPAELRVLEIVRNENDVTVIWTGGAGPYAIETAEDLNSPAWVRRTNPLPAAEAATLSLHGAVEFFRVVDLGR